MQVSIESVILSKSWIWKVSLNPTRGVLAAIVEGCDTVSFYRLGSEAKELFVGESKPAGRKSVLAWSPDGAMLAVGSASMEIWELGSSLKPRYTFTEDFLDIRLLAWSPDSTHLAYAGSSRSHSVKLRTLLDDTLPPQQIALECEIAALNYDPFGKYLLVLLRSNILVFYSSFNCIKLTQIPLSPGANPLLITPTVKELRTLDWSPDFQNLVLPSLDDSRLPLAVSLSRLKEFKSERVFIGHTAPISCVKFNPLIFHKDGAVVSVLAMGDTCGTVSLWNLASPTPLLLFNTMHDSLEIVEDLEWTSDGLTLISNVLKRYVYLYRFEPNAFGNEIPAEEVSHRIESTFGVKSVAQIFNTELEVFQGRTLKRTLQNRISNDLIPQTDEEAVPHKIIVHTTNPITTSISLQNNISKYDSPTIKSSDTLNLHASNHEEKEVFNLPKLNNGFDDFGIPKKEERVNNGIFVPSQLDEVSKVRNIEEKVQNSSEFMGQESGYLKVQVQKVTIDKNNRKRIQPALLVRKTEVSNQSESYFNQISSLISKLHPVLCLAPISIGANRCYALGDGYVEVVQNAQKTVLQVTNGERQMRRIFPGTVQYVESTSAHIYVVADNRLLILDKELSLCELPIVTGSLHRLAVNLEGDVYLLSTNGQIRGFNPGLRTCYTPTPVLLQQLYCADDHSNAPTIVIERMCIASNKCLQILLKINERLEEHFYDYHTQQWLSLQLNEGVLKEGFSARMSPFDLDLERDFFEKMCPMEAKEGSYEANLIYYSKYCPDREQYKNNLIAELRDLKNKKKDDILRIYLHKYFVDKDSKVYESEIQLRERVKEIGGTIIDEFLSFMLL